MRKCAEYRAMAIAHARLALITQSDELCETHVRIAASFLALANKQAMRDLRQVGPTGPPLRVRELHLGRPVSHPLPPIGR